MAYSFPASLSNTDRALIKAHLRKLTGIKVALSTVAPGRLLRDCTVAQLAELCRMAGVDAVAIVNAAASNATPAAVAAAVAAEDAADIAETAEDLAPVSTPSSAATPESEDLDLAAIAARAEAAIGAYSAVLHPTLSQGLASAIKAMEKEAGRMVADLSAKLSQAPQAVSSAPSSSRAGVSTVGKVFGIKGQWSSIKVSLWTPCASTPAVDHGYVFDPEALGLLISAMERGDYSWLYGAKGAGKTELVKQIAARTGRPFVRIGVSGDMDKYAVLGVRKLVNGSQVWEDGVLTAAIRNPGCVVLVDEPSVGQAGFLAMFQTSLDIRRLTLEETAEDVPFADGVTFFAADNTDGYGDASGSYHGTSAMNEAFLDRFSRKLYITTPSRETLGRIITSRTGLATDAALMLADVIKVTENMAKKGNLTTHLSLRPVLAFAKDVVAKMPSLKACMESTLLSSLPSAEAVAARNYILAQLDLDKLNAAAHPGEALPPQPTLSQAAMAAKDEFGPTTPGNV